MNDYGIENIKSYRYFLIVFDNFSKFGWTIPVKNKYAQSITDAFSQFSKTSKSKPNLLETDDGKEYVNKIFSDFLDTNNIEDIHARWIKELFLQNDLIELYKI